MFISFRRTQRKNYLRQVRGPNKMLSNWLCTLSELYLTHYLFLQHSCITVLLFILKTWRIVVTKKTRWIMIPSSQIYCLYFVFYSNALTIIAICKEDHEDLADWDIWYYILLWFYLFWSYLLSYSDALHILTKFIYFTAKKTSCTTLSQIMLPITSTFWPSWRC